jgi:tRNA A-37 threonylcarbamoyl transferase component Bud32
MVFQEFIQGEKLVAIIKRIFSSNKTVEDVALVKEVGVKIAEVHGLGVSLGDCKPENFIISKNEIFLLDLEQASRNGNQAWDIAEFLYYSGHYSPPMSSSNAAGIITTNFLEGYLEAGGKREAIKKVASARYTKVFSIFTPPHVLFAISNLCQKMGRKQAEKET